MPKIRKRHNAPEVKKNAKNVSIFNFSACFVKICGSSHRHEFILLTPLEPEKQVVQVVKIIQGGKYPGA